MRPHIADDRLDNMLLLIGIQFWIDRNRDCFLGRLLRLRKRTRLGPQSREALLAMQWNGIVDIVPDPVLDEMGTSLSLMDSGTRIAYWL